MTEREFKTLLEETKIKKSIATGSELAYFTGFEKGIRRAYYGEGFGSQSEHEAMLMLANSLTMEKEKARGYIDALLEKGLTSNEIALICNVSKITVRKWAHKNGVNKVILKNNLIGYVFSKKDYDEFSHRNKVAHRPKKV